MDIMSPSAACIHLDPRNSRIFEVFSALLKGGSCYQLQEFTQTKKLRPGLQGKISTSSSWPQPRSRTQPRPTAAPGLVTKDTTDFTKERPVLPLGGWEGPWGPWEANGWKRSPASWCLTSFDNPNRFLAWNPLFSPHISTWTLCFSISCWDVSHFVLVKSCKIRPHRTLASPPSLLFSGSLLKPLKWLQNGFQMVPGFQLNPYLFWICLDQVESEPKPRLPDSHPQPQKVKRPVPSRNEFAPTWSAPRTHANQWFWEPSLGKCLYLDPPSTLQNGVWHLYFW